MTRYGISFTTLDRPVVFESESGEYTEEEADRYMDRWQDAAAALAAENPPMLDKELRLAALDEIARASGEVPDGETVLRRILTAEGFDSDA